MIDVLKFGGSSLQTEETRNYVIKQINKRLLENKKLVIVVSAMGRYNDPYATDTLKSLVIQPSRQESDLLLCCGEIISSVVLSDSLQGIGIKSIALNPFEIGIHTTQDFTDAAVLRVDPSRIIRYLDTYDVVIVPGFQGMTEDFKVTTLGRGGSDFTAVLLGASLGCSHVSIFSDVVGVMTANPKIVNNASLIKEINYDEIIHLSYQGAKVINHKAVEYAKDKQIELHLYSTFEDECGTKIKSVPYSNNKYGVCGIGSFDHLTLVEISDNKSIDASVIFKTLADANISLDFLYISLKKISFTILSDHYVQVAKLFSEIGIKAKFQSNLAKIAVVGTNMKGKAGVMQSILYPLMERKITIYQTADSHITIWLLVNEKDLKESLNLIHRSFNLDGGN